MKLYIEKTMVEGFEGKEVEIEERYIQLESKEEAKCINFLRDMLLQQISCSGSIADEEVPEVMFDIDNVVSEENGAFVAYETLLKV